MQNKRVVKVYQKPLTNEDFEGQAALIKKAKIQHIPKPGFEYWFVRFLDDENPVLRLINMV